MLSPCLKVGTWQTDIEMMSIRRQERAVHFVPQVHQYVCDMYIYLLPSKQNKEEQKLNANTVIITIDDTDTTPALKKMCSAAKTQNNKKEPETRRNIAVAFSARETAVNN